jgi:hypothetical protein
MISGTVTNAAGAPLHGVSLQLMPLVAGRNSTLGAPALNAAAETDSQGNFTFEEVDPGRYLLGAQRAGYLQTGYYNERSRVLKVERGQKVVGIAIKMTPQGIIGGRVVDEDGEPLTGLTVGVLLSSVPTELLRTAAPIGEGKTDADGAFAIGGIAPGRYIIAVEAPPTPESPVTSTTQRKQKEIYVMTYYPEATGFEEATPVELSAGGQARGLVIRLRKVPVFRVSGRVINTVTGEAGSAVLNLFRRGGVPGLSAHSVGVNAGDFSFEGISPGNYVLETKSTGDSEDRPPLVARQVVSVGSGDLDRVVVEMKPGVEVRGNVIVEGAPPSSWPQIALTPAEGLNYPTSMPMIDGNGRFTVTGLEPAPYDLYIGAIPPPMFLKEIRLNGRTLNGQINNGRIDLASERAASLEITISDRGGSISGIVSDSGVPVGPGIMVTAAGKTQGPVRVRPTDESGRFSLAGLPPGDYFLTAMDTGPGFLRLAPGVMEKLGKVVTVGESASAAVELRLITMDDLRP